MRPLFRRKLSVLLATAISLGAVFLFRKSLRCSYSQAVAEPVDSPPLVTFKVSPPGPDRPTVGTEPSLAKILEEKLELLFTFSELISFGTGSPSLPRPRCQDGIEDSVLRNHTRLLQHLREITNLPGFVSPGNERRIFIAALLRNSCALASHFALEIIKFVHIAGADRSRPVFVSVLESGSTDCSKRVVRLLKEILDKSNVSNNIRFGISSQRGKGTRVDHLQMLRNEVLRDLYSSGREYDEVVFLNDVYFCASDILRLLRHRAADIKCGLDMETIGNEPQFYDTWVARDIAGELFSKRFPFVSELTSINAVKQKLPFQVTCCWNGLAVLKAAAFAKGVRFRRSVSADECHASECEIICHDFAALGYPRVLVDPNVFVAYDAQTFESLEREEYNLRPLLPYRGETLEVYRDRPACSVCIPLDGSKGRDPDHKKSHTFNWLQHYQKNGVPVATTTNVTSLHDCEDTFARSCALSRGKRVKPVIWNASACRA